jgi:type II secretory pathway component PulF
MLFSKYFSYITKKEVALFSHQLASLLGSGIPVLKALDVYLEQVQNKHFRIIIFDIKQKIENGQSFSSSINGYPKIFSPFYQAMVKSGENSGSLDKSLRLIASYYMKEIELVSKIKSALAYPVLIFVVGVLTVLFIFVHVMPRIIPIFDNLDVEKPFATKVLIGTSSFLEANWFWLLVGVFILFLIFRRATKSKIFLYHLSSLRLSLPVVGPLCFKSDVARFSRALEITLSRGVSVMAAVRSVIPVLNEYCLWHDLEQAPKELAFGRSLTEVFVNANIFPPFVISLVNMGQESGNLASAFSDIADSYEQDCQELIKTLTNLIEPVMVLAVGLFVGFIVASALLPILNLNFIQF